MLTFILEVLSSRSVLIARILSSFAMVIVVMFAADWVLERSHPVQVYSLSEADLL